MINYQMQFKRLENAFDDLLDANISFEEKETKQRQNNILEKIDIVSKKLSIYRASVKNLYLGGNK